MKKINLKSVKEYLSRDEMKTVKGGSGWITCNDGTSMATSSCSDWAISYYCRNHGGFRICSG